MLIKCKECGEEISNRAKICPKCGCPNYFKVKSKLAVASLVLGIVAVVYGFGLCINDFFTENTQSTILPTIIIMSILSIAFGLMSICKTKSNSKSLIGIILSILAITVSILGSLLF